MTQPQLIRRHFYFASWILASCIVYRVPLINLIHYALAQATASHILLVLPISACVIYLQRREIFAGVHSSNVAGLALLVVAIVAGWLAHTQSGHVDLWLKILALLRLWISGFTAFYGTDVLRRARFALFFLILLIPVP